MNSKAFDTLMTELHRRTLLKAAVGLGAGIGTMRLFAMPARAAVGGSLQILAWEGYDLTRELADWRAAKGVASEVTTITTQEDVQTKFVAGNPPPIDIAVFNQAYSKLYTKEMKIALPIDRSRVPNYNPDNLFDIFYDKPMWFSDGELLGSPYIWGQNSLVYNPAKMEAPTSYADLLKPELKGRIAIWDETTSAWPIAARVAGLGDKYPNLTRDELAAAFAELGKYRDQARVIALNMGEMLNFFVSGEIDAVLASDPWVIDQAAQQGLELKLAAPKEGAVLWVDAWFIPISSDNIETAHAFLDASLDPEVQAKVAMAVQQSPVSKKAVDFLDDAAKARVDYSRIDTIFAAGLPGIPALETEGDIANYQDWLAAWQGFKAGQ